MNPIEVQALRVIEEIAALGEMAEACGAHGLGASTFAAILMLADSANEDGIKVDCDALGIVGE